MLKPQRYRLDPFGWPEPVQRLDPIVFVVWSLVALGGLGTLFLAAWKLVELLS